MIVPTGLLFPNDGKDHRKEKIGLFMSFPVIMGLVVGFISGSIVDGLKAVAITAAIIAAVAGVVYVLYRFLNGLSSEMDAKPKINMGELFALLFVGAGLIGGVLAMLS